MHNIVKRAPRQEAGCGDEEGNNSARMLALLGAPGRSCDAPFPLAFTRKDAVFDFRRAKCRRFPGQCWPTSVSAGPRVAECRVKGRPTSAQCCGRRWAKSRGQRVRANAGRLQALMLVEVGPFRAKHGRNRAKFGRIRAEFGRARTNAGRLRENVGRRCPPCRAKWHRARAKFRRLRANGSRFGAEFDRFRASCS